jgi:hypothetical protein
MAGTCVRHCQPHDAIPEQVHARSVAAIWDRAQGGEVRHSSWASMAAGQKRMFRRFRRTIFSAPADAAAARGGWTEATAPHPAL